ncbi:hypothetical protein ACF065_22485 [Streptomyces sp. NPDC015232]|uniref:hypothetical protein n=1 Tax=unclassified Streptomyces TaxID=2593676 RepID=UPI0036FA4F09
MGNYFQTVVDLDATHANARSLADSGLDWLVGEGIVRAELTDCVLGAPSGHPPGSSWARAVRQPDWEPGGGLRIEIGRTVFGCGQGEPLFAVCPHCSGRTDFHTDRLEEIEGMWEPFGEAVEAWTDTGTASVTCPRCRRPGDLTGWTWSDDYFAFGYLGFVFWDWPDFSTEFLDAFSRVLAGHRTVLVEGEL